MDIQQPKTQTTSLKIVPDMTYNVFGGTLNLAQSITSLRNNFSGTVHVVFD